MSYLLRKIGQKSTSDGIFNLVPYDGKEPISNQEKGYAVNDGICYSTFSYDSGSYIPIKNMNTALSLGKNHVVYIEFGISPNMQVTGAQIKSSLVGKELKDSNKPGWIDYPNYYKITPNDKVVNGMVTYIAQGKRQENCYLMIGKCYDQLSDLEKNYKAISVSSLANKWTGYYVQYVDTNMIMMGSQVSGVPVLFPMPFWGGPGSSDNNKLNP